MSILDAFCDERVSGTLSVLTNTKQADSRNRETYTAAGTFQGNFFYRSVASRIFSVQLAEDVVATFVIPPTTAISAGDHFAVNGVNYEVDSTQDINLEGEVMLVGLKNLK